MEKPSQEEAKKICLQNIDRLRPLVESGEVTEILFFGVLDQDKFDYCSGVAMMASNVGRIITHEFLKMLEEEKLT